MALNAWHEYAHMACIYGCLVSRSRVSGHSTVNLLANGVFLFFAFWGEISCIFDRRTFDRNNMTPESGALFGGSLRSSNHRHIFDSHFLGERVGQKNTKAGTRGPAIRCRRGPMATSRHARSGFASHRACAPRASCTQSRTVGLGMLGGVPGGYMGGGESIGRAREGSAPW